MNTLQLTSYEHVFIQKGTYISDISDNQEALIKMFAINHTM